MTIPTSSLTRLSAFLAVGAFLIAAAGPANAQRPSLSELQNQINQLQDRVADLQAQRIDEALLYRREVIAALESRIERLESR